MAFSWLIYREASNNLQKEGDINKISIKTSRGFNLIDCQTVPILHLNRSLGNLLNGIGNEKGVKCERDVYVCYKLPYGGSPELKCRFTPVVIYILLFYFFSDETGNRTILFLSSKPH